MKLIYQIGRFEVNSLNPINFRIENQVFRTSLSSLALKEYFNKNNNSSKVVLLYPVSLLFNKRVIENSSNLPEDLKKNILKVLDSNEEKNSFFLNPYPYYKLNPHSKLVDSFLVIHSIGEYEGVKFQTTFEELVLEIFIDIVEKYLNEPFKVLYLDISSGLNIYVSSLIEAGRLFLTFYKLQNFLPEEEPLKVILYFSDPIMQPFADRDFELHLHYELEVKTFFSFPQLPDQISIENAYTKFIKTLANGDRETKQYFNKLLASILTDGYLFFSALKNNTPLVLYTFSHHQEEKVILVMRELIEFLKRILYQNFQKAPNLKIEQYRKLFLMLSIYLGIIKILKKHKISQNQEVPISELVSNFKDPEKTIFKYFDLSSHSSFFAQELENNFLKEENKKNFTSDFKLLKDFISGESKDNDIHPRNFIAHCGFERNCVEIKKVGEDVWIRYKNDSKILERIKKILLEN